MNIETSAGGIPLGSPWLKPMDVKILGGLRSMISQNGDTSNNILRPRLQPSQNRKTGGYITV